MYIGIGAGAAVIVIVILIIFIIVGCLIWRKLCKGEKGQLYSLIGARQIIPHFLPIMLLGTAPNSTLLCFEINPIMLTYFMLYSSIDYQIRCNSKVTGLE